MYNIKAWEEELGAKRILTRVLISITFCAFTLLFSTCGGGRQPSTPPSRRDPAEGRVNFSPAENVGSPGRPGLKPDVIRGNGKSVALADVLTELEDMPAPAGVDVDIFAQLKDELARQLSTYSESRWDPAEGRVNFSPALGAGLKPSVLLDKNKLVSKPPRGAKNVITDLKAGYSDEESLFTFRWPYQNVGDYDQNGIVSISDITPIAEHFSEQANEGNYWIDGTGDGVINIQDVTPIAEHFFSQVAGYLIEATGGEEGWTFVGEIPFSDSAKDASGKARFTLPVPAEMLSGFLRCRVVPVDSEANRGDPSNGVGIGIPVGVVTANPVSGEVPLLVTFDADASSDPDGGDIVYYEWDLDGDGTYGDVAGRESRVQFTYEVASPVDVSVKVTDDEAFKSNSEPILVDPLADQWIHTWGWNELNYVVSGDSYFYEVSYDRVSAISVDASGNVYGVGSVNPYGVASSNALVLKYDLGGRLKWAKTLSVPTDRDDYYSGPSLADILIGNDGNLVIIGMASQDPYHPPFPEWPMGSYLVLLKLTPDGDLLWKKKWALLDVDNPEFPMSEVRRIPSVVLDEADNIYVSFSVDGRRPVHADGVLQKYSPSGELLWEKFWGYPGVYGECSNPVILPEGNILLVVNTKPPSEPIFKPYFIKVTADGGILSSSTMTFTFPNLEHAGEVHEILGDGLGRVFVQGTFPSGVVDFLSLVDVNTWNIEWSRYLNREIELHSNPSTVPKAMFLSPTGDLMLLQVFNAVPPYDLRSLATVAKVTDAGVDVLSWGGYPTDIDEDFPVGWASSASIAFGPTGKLYIGGASGDVYGKSWQTFHYSVPWSDLALEVFPGNVDELTLPTLFGDLEGELVDLGEGIQDIGAEYFEDDVAEKISQLERNSDALVMKIDTNKL